MKCTQKTWFYKEYGPKEVLQFGDFPMPSPKSDQVLVQVKASALNPIDFKMRQRPIVPTPLPVVPGCDMAGVVVGSGDGVSKFRIGDEVYGNIQDFHGELKQLGTLAQYIVVEESLVAMKPPNLTFEEAASLPLALQTAVEGFKTAKFKAGQTVFVVGGAGGVGSLAVQLANNVFGASKVAATCSTKKVEFVKSLGAEVVVDYTQQGYHQILEKFDFIFDTIGDTNKSYVVAKEEGAVVDITWPPSNPRAVISSLVVSGDGLARLHPYILSGKLKPIIDLTSPYDFDRVPEAFAYLETGRAWGKVVISSISS
ncbi:2-methylene-furan-3-one reductase isoform X1 [Amborella trichopoda]|uniref:Enoyl reductase (ER) domain-containing protein n=1 Tax=Amborella trichopoda TaxID=13333 RepID=U5DGA3_AMBTC|nr:2-methylene-furan-3-one reductase isoform X1 [Amborella trichopoda]ERN19463.1 hypothetical protein AMTR_s00069p00186560 [Amborella trichopoda]|eukprot:XP_006857996.1 2-methylene-furan-3-one reductase isoform X1 [Amborella trichopoda]